MKTRSSAKPFRFLALAALALAAGARGDDRLLLSQGGDKPYIFVILDTSGSMNWQPGGDAFTVLGGDGPASKMYQAKSALYRVLTDPELAGIHWGFAQYNQDEMRVYRKHWAYAISTTPVWATNGEDFHYPMPLSSQYGQGKVFGDACIDSDDADGTGTSACELDQTPTSMGACQATYGDNRFIDDYDEEALEAYTFPVLGDGFDTPTTQYLDHISRRYKLEWSKKSGVYGDPTITVTLKLTRFNSSDTNCDGSPIGASWGPIDYVFERVVATDSQSRILAGANEKIIYYNENSNSADPWDLFDSNPDEGGTCEGLETNSATDDDDLIGSPNYSVKVANQNDPAGRGASFRRGDFVPLDWKDDQVWPASTSSTMPAAYKMSNLNFIKQRLAPNLITNPNATGVGVLPDWNIEPWSLDFRAAPYFQDHPTGGLVPLRPASDSEGRVPLNAGTVIPPLIPNGSTPLGNSLKDFMDWFDGWKGGAQAGDLKFTCRSTNVVFLTDGDETCYGGATNGAPQDGGGDWNPCHVADQLLNVADRNVKTYVVGFGLQDSDNFLRCMSQKGGTFKRDVDGDGVIETSYDANNDGDVSDPGEGGQEGGPYLPGNEDELVEALTEAFISIREGAASFASAAVPSVQADAADKVFLTEFRPVDENAVWPGRFYAFIKPVPLNEARRPDLTQICDGPNDASCVAWEAQEVVVEEQVKPSVGDPVGNAANQRRVFYAEHETGSDNPQRRHYLEALIGGVTDQREDLWRALGIIGPTQEIESMTSAQRTSAENAANSLIGQTLALKEATPSSGAPIEYVMGDNFHSDPLSIGDPNNVRYFVGDVGAHLTVDSICGDDSLDPDRSYRQFATRHRNRRRMLALGTNDGMLHVIDTGVYRENSSNPSLPGRFDNGTGRELFAFVPRLMMSRLTDLYDSPDPQPIYGADGRTVAADVLIDPVNAGWGSGDEPQPCERIWRTVVAGGLREGVTSVPASERPLAAFSQTAVVGSYYFLDVTRPDAPLVQRDSDGFFYVPEVSGDAPPSCFGDGEGSAGSLPADCGDYPFGGVLFEFNDMVNGVRLDEDNGIGNGHIDLAATWSTPNLGRMQVCTANCNAANIADRTIEDRFVAVFGGGLDPDNTTTRGNWLYIVDVETGEAIYKEQLRGAAPAEPAAVDIDLDGYFDRIYIGTLYGFMYRVDLVQGSGATRIVPELVNYVLTEQYCADAILGGVCIIPGTRTRTVKRITAATFEPRIVFSASANNATDTVTTVENSPGTMRPIYFRPSVIFVPELEQYAIAFGTGNREDLTLKNSDCNCVPPARFFTVVDDRPWSALSDASNFQAPNRSALATIDLTSAANANASSNFLTGRPVNQRGWWMEFATDERLVTDPTTIVGVLIFSVFKPRTDIIEEGVCGETGTSRLFAVVATNASGLLFTNPDGTPIYGGAPPEDPDGDGPLEAPLQNPGLAGVQSRYKVISDLVTQPFAEQSQTKNPPSDPRDYQYGEELLSTSQRQAMDAIKNLLPPNCKFPPGYRIDLKTRDSKTGIEWIAPIPLCVMEKNFKDF